MVVGMASVVGCIIRVIPNLHIALNPLPAFLLGSVAVQSFHPTAVSFPKPLKVTVAVSDSNFRCSGFLCESMGNQAGKCTGFRDS